jgi:hypothetical protein
MNREGNFDRKSDERKSQIQNPEISNWTAMRTCVGRHGRPTPAAANYAEAGVAESQELCWIIAASIRPHAVHVVLKFRDFGSEVSVRPTSDSER